MYSYTYYIHTYIDLKVQRINVILFVLGTLGTPRTVDFPMVPITGTTLM